MEARDPVKILIKKETYDDSIVKCSKSLYRKYSSKVSKKLVIVIDFSIPMETERLYIVDLDQNKIILRSKVCHGSGSGRTPIPTLFSNIPESKMSSLGVMKTAESYYGSFGYSMRVDGLQSQNSKVRERAIIFHSSKKQRTSWSWGCFSVPDDCIREIIDLTKGGSLIFVFNQKSQLYEI